VDPIASHEAGEALAAVARARRQVADEVGLPRGYWWGMAAGWVVLGAVGMLVLLVALTVAAALLIDADGAGHAAIWAALVVAPVVGFGGPEILRTLRRWVRT
jgi:hypothetical protein